MREDLNSLYDLQLGESNLELSIRDPFLETFLSKSSLENPVQEIFDKSLQPSGFPLSPDSLISSTYELVTHCTIFRTSPSHVGQYTAED